MKTGLQHGNDIASCLYNAPLTFRFVLIKAANWYCFMWEYLGGLSDREAAKKNDAHSLLLQETGDILN